jgi:type IV pilus biogenesis protein CpaD/CtpE
MASSLINSFAVKNPYSSYSDSFPTFEVRMSLTEVFLLAATLAIAGCNAPPTSADRYKFEVKQTTNFDTRVMVVEHESLRELQRAATKAGAKTSANQDLQAFSVMYPKSDRCVIHIIDPSVRYVPEFIGHELTHCIYGQFHPSRNRG